MNQDYKSKHRYDFLTKELLENEYCVNGLSDRDIANKYDMPSKTVVWRKRKKFGILNKHKNKSNKNASNNRKFDITLEQAINFREDGLTYKQISEKLGCSLRVINRRFEELGLVKKTDQEEKYKYFNVELGSSQKNMIIGSLLGDGHINKSGAYSCSHSKKQSEYFLHKFHCLDNIFSGKIQTYSQELCGTQCYSLRATTGCNKFLLQLRDIFYPLGVKIIPYYYLADHLNAEGLAYWICDDGSFHKNHKYMRIYSQSFTHFEHIMMKRIFHKNFGVVPKLVMEKQRGDQLHLKFTVSDSEKIISLIKPYVSLSMKYKIGE
tara:strand:- start:604 stop:1566 length:963 start_codon:yes stop_codon:yes gene_type:complete